jgi:hypothetical protein
MQEQMIHHHYPLQAHLYLVALHRHLSWRLPDYNPEQHLGGICLCLFERDAWRSARFARGQRNCGTRTSGGTCTVGAGFGPGSCLV